jgi:acyl CoA:acetate/3-ketoacid CoA transferase beta subunit
LHGVSADRHGNVVLAAPYGEGFWGAMAARRGVVAGVERIVSTEQIRAMNTHVKIPGHVVSAVCEVPAGSHPYGLNSPDVDGVTSYVEDSVFLASVLRAAREPSSFREWIDEWVLGVSDHAGYLAKLGADRVQTLMAASRPESWLADADESWLPDEPATPIEVQVVVTARMLEERVRAIGADVVLAGVGLSNLAAWIGVEKLRKSGIDVELTAEIGLYGYSPRPGEPFIFAGRNVPTNKMLTDVMGVLGTLVPGPGTRSIGIIGAGQIDRTGATNSTYASDGSFIVGSGGANDVLSAADEVIVTVGHDDTRLVEKVGYVTCPGDRVRLIVTDLAVFERGVHGDFVLTRTLPKAGADTHAAIAAIQGATGWEFSVAKKVISEPLPTVEELATLRVFDPEKQFLRDRRR